MVYNRVKIDAGPGEIQCRMKSVGLSQGGLNPKKKTAVKER